MRYKANWSDLKSFVTDRDISIQWTVNKGLYWLVAIDGNLEMTTQIPIVTPAISGSDQDDFEKNFKAVGNRSPHGNMVQVLGKDTLSLLPFAGIINPAANTTTDCDIPIPFMTVVKGGILFSQNAAIGDYIVVEVIDKDNVLGQGASPENPLVLGQYVYKWYIMPGVPNVLEDISISQALPQGLYFRFTYTSVGSTAPTVLVNFISYVTIS